MSEIIPDTELVITGVCPGCTPDFDPRRNDTLWCEPHWPDRAGALDHVVDTGQYLSGSGEAEGVNNKKWCDLVHRKKED